jgi:hypothetical protein
MEYDNEFGVPIEAKLNYHTSSAVPQDEERFPGESGLVDSIITGSDPDKVIDNLFDRAADPLLQNSHDGITMEDVRGFLARNVGLIRRARRNKSTDPNNDPDFGIK